MSEDGEKVALPHSYTEIIYSQFPLYLALGMTEEQYFDRDSTLVIYYRKADEIRKQKQNTMAWLQGMYIYDTILRLAPAIRPFGKKGTKAQPYVEEPYPITEKEIEKKQEKKEKANANKGLLYMQSLMSSTNKKFEKKEGEPNGNND